MAGRRRQKGSQDGMTLIELLLAMAMLATGMVGVLALLVASIGGNGRNKMDAAGTLLAQMVTDKIVSRPAHVITPVTVQDCNPAGPTTWTVATATGGANLVNATGAINWGDDYAGVPDNYKMQYVSCGANGEQTTYELRWNVQVVNGYSKMVTVGARALGAQNADGVGLLYFARPVTLRTIISD